MRAREAAEFCFGKVDHVSSIPFGQIASILAMLTLGYVLSRTVGVFRSE
jgi:hypothetical protein